MMNTSTTEDVKSLDEIVTKMREINKQTKTLHALIEQMNVYRDQLMSTIIQYGSKTDEIHSIYANIFDKMTPIFESAIAEKPVCMLTNEECLAVYALFQKARLLHYRTQLVIPVFKLKQSN